MRIADRILTLRKMKGLSQEELADRIGVSRQAVSKWESEQSVPDLEKVVLLSEFFDVTTDYLLMGIEPVKDAERHSNVLTSRILYAASTAFIAIGLLCAFGGWYAQQSAESIWGSMIVQVLGVAGYCIGKYLSPAKPPFAVIFLNTALALFMPVSLLAAATLGRPAAPYPTDLPTLCVFAAAYGGAAALAFVILKKREKRV